MSPAPVMVENEDQVASPALILHWESVEENLRRMIAIAGDPARLRPHVKTHKLGPLVKRQIELISSDDRSDTETVAAPVGRAYPVRSSAMACTVAVEEAIDEHYQAQERALGDDEATLRGHVEKFRAEELELIFEPFERGEDAGKAGHRSDRQQNHDECKCQ